MDWAAAGEERQLDTPVALAVAEANADAVPPPEAVADAWASVCERDGRVRFRMATN